MKKFVHIGLLFMTGVVIGYGMMMKKLRRNGSDQVVQITHPVDGLLIGSRWIHSDGTQVTIMNVDAQLVFYSDGRWQDNMYLDAFLKAFTPQEIQ